MLFSNAVASIPTSPRDAYTSLSSAQSNENTVLAISAAEGASGVAYTKAELAELGEVLRRYPQVVIATDDMYEHILWADEPFCNILNACPDLYDRIIVLNGVSKAYSMTGWRIGYAAGPKPLINAMKKIQSQSTSNPTSISQVAAQIALQGDQACINEMLGAFKQRHDYVVDALNDIHGIHCIPSQGTFYAFPSVQGVINSHREAQDDVELAEFLLNEAEVALVPGSAFGAPGYMRLSYATGLDTLKTAIERIRIALDKN